MSTEERREEETKEGEEAKSESSIVVSSLEEEAITAGLQTRLPAELPIPPAITPTVITTTAKAKAINFDDYDTDIMSSDSYIKSIPTIKSGITAAEFAVKEVALKSVLAIRNCSEFYMEKKHKSLSATEDGGAIDDEKDVVKCHLIGISIITMACQNNVTIMSYVEESKDDVD
ncbi:MAG: hypothetical protein ACI8RD_007484 [Bacillariaceae sp.]|jgi:hypothetical protein